MLEATSAPSLSAREVGRRNCPRAQSHRQSEKRDPPKATPRTCAKGVSSKASEHLSTCGPIVSPLHLHTAYGTILPRASFEIAQPNRDSILLFKVARPNFRLLMLPLPA